MLCYRNNVKGGGKVGNSVVVSETLIIALGAMVVALAILILYAVTLIIKFINTNRDEKVVYTEHYNPIQSIQNSGTSIKNNVQSFSDDDEEERLVVALAASALAASDKPNTHFHIKRITRIK
jgi:glutaconyl-CoA/methylmalonyl-CoA decarboxylase subunit delta